MSHRAISQARSRFRVGYVALTLSCAVILASAEEPKGASQAILFAVRDYQRSGVVVSSVGEKVRVLVEPIAFVSDGTLIKLPDAPDLDSFARSYYPKDRTYDLIAAGKITGKVRIDANAFDVQCESLAASGTVTPAGAVSGMRLALASNIGFHDPQFTRRPATADERARIVAVVQDIYRENKVAPEVAAAAKARNVTAFDRAEQSLLIASFQAEQLRHEGDYDANYVNAVFVIAEREANGPYRVTHKWFHVGVDVLDLSGTGSIDVVTQFGYYEAVEYHVYRRKGEQWEDFYQQFGAGC